MYQDWMLNRHEAELLGRVAARAGRRLERHFGVHVNSPFHLEVQCSRAQNNESDCAARFQNGCTTHFFAYQWCALTEVDRSRFWDCYIDTKVYLTSAAARLDPGPPTCTHPLVCYSCTIMGPTALLFGLYAYFARRFREFACCLVFLAVLVCLGPYRLPPCDADPCHATSPDQFLGQQCGQ